MIKRCSYIKDSWYAQTPYVLKAPWHIGPYKCNAWLLCMYTLKENEVSLLNIILIQKDNQNSNQTKKKTSNFFQKPTRWIMICRFILFFCQLYIYIFRLYTYIIYTAVNIYPENNQIKGGFFFLIILWLLS